MLNFLPNKRIFTPIYNYPKNTHFTLSNDIKLLEDNNYLINLIANYDFSILKTKARPITIKSY